MYFAPLPHRAVIAVSGEESTAFLQGLVSNNVGRVGENEAVYAALLSPQGKFLHDMFLVKAGAIILIDCERERMEDLRKRLTLYKLRSKVTIEPLPQLQVIAVWGNQDSGFRIQDSGISGTIIKDPRLPELGFRIISKAESISAASGDYDAMRLALGVPDGSRDLIVDKSILLEWGFEDLHGVDFLKGCYIGQEVTARSKYRGQLKKTIHQVKSISGELPQAGTPIMALAQAIGEMRSSNNGIGLAIIRAEELRQAQEKNLPIKAGDAEITAALPKWFTLPA